MDKYRKNDIKLLIEDKGRISLDQLVKIYPQISSMTLRRDLLALEQEGIVIRVRGGAISVRELNRNVEDIYSQRANSNTDLKKDIAEKALDYIERGQSIYIDSGSTTLYFAKMLKDINYFITTNGLNIALELSRRTMPIINVVGGVLSKENLASSGSMSLSFIDNINIDVAFMACSGYTDEGGFMCGSLTENELKTSVIAKAKKVIMLMDSSKIGRGLPYTFATMKDVDVLITESSYKK